MNVQIVGIKTWEFLVLMGPSLLITIGLLLVFLFGRFVGHYEEQHNILKNLPSIIQEEVNKAYKRIEELETELTLVKKLYDALKIAAHFTIMRAMQIVQALQEGFNGTIKQIEER